MISALIIFIVSYLLFLIAGLLFPIDKKWYAQLKKPVWTPSGRVIGIIWGVLFLLISLSLAMVQYKVGLRHVSVLFLEIWVLNYVANQAFSFFQFKMKNLLLAAFDCSLVAITAIYLIYLTWPSSPTAAVLLIPYALWTAFATYLAFRIEKMNR